MLPENLKQTFFANKITLIFILAIILLIVGALFLFRNVVSPATEVPLQEVDLPFDAEGPFALLFPRRDGNALVLNLKRTASYDSISYELAYTSLPDESVSEDVAEGSSIDRGVVGNIDTKSKKGEYEQEVLFGTCSKNVCKYDKGIENGTLTLHIRKGDLAYKMVTQWHLQKPEVALGILTSGDGHFSYKMSAEPEELALVGYSIINDLTGLPKLPENTEVVGKVYALNVPLAKELSGGEVNIELSESPPDGVKIGRYDEVKNTWDLMETQNTNGKLKSTASSGGIFAVLTPKK